MDTIAQRTRRQIVANSLVALAQGIPFFQAGDDLLRSKDMDNNSYNSGDWFNDIDFVFKPHQTGAQGFRLRATIKAIGRSCSRCLPMPPLYLKPTAANIDLARRVFQEFLTIRASSSLFRMSTLAEVQANLHFLNTGPKQTPGLIAMTLNGKAGKCGQYSQILVLFNAATDTINFQDNSLKGLRLQLHPAQVRSADAIVRQSSFNSVTGTAVVPGLTTAVFVSDDGR